MLAALSTADLLVSRIIQGFGSKATCDMMGQHGTFCPSKAYQQLPLGMHMALEAVKMC